MRRRENDWKSKVLLLQSVAFSLQTHTHTPVQTFVKLGRFYTLGSDGQIMWPLSSSTYCKKSNHLVAIDCFHLKAALMGCNKGHARLSPRFYIFGYAFIMHMSSACPWDRHPGQPGEYAREYRGIDWILCPCVGENSRHCFKLKGKKVGELQIL